MATAREVFLAHASAQIYDPAERRERYLRERQLKGRQPGSAEITTGKNPPRAPAAPSGQKVASAPKSAPPSSSAAPITPQRVAEMKVRLAQLKELLTKLTEEANKKAGVEPTTKKDSADKKESADTKKPEKKTTAEKKEAADKAKEERKKDPKSSDTVNSLQTQLNAVHEKIADMRAKIAALSKAAAAKPTPPSKDTKSKEKDKGESKAPKLTTSKD